MEQKFKRLITRSDFDGLACAMMLKELHMIDEIKFVHPKDVQDGKIELTKEDITTNLPYDPRVGMAFDHHESEIDRLRAQETGGKLIIDPNARELQKDHDKKNDDEDDICKGLEDLPGRIDGSTFSVNV